MIQLADRTRCVAVMTVCVAGTAESGHNAFTVVQVGVIVDNVQANREYMSLSLMA